MLPRHLGWTLDTSTPAKHQSNAIAERMVQTVKKGTKRVLRASGLPQEYWPYATRAFCFAYNTELIDNDSAWARRHQNGNFTSNKYPFGCVVSFLPTKSQRDQGNLESDSHYGIFLGYKVLSGGRYHGEYLVASYSDMRRYHMGGSTKPFVQTVQVVSWNGEFIFSVQIMA